MESGGSTWARGAPGSRDRGGLFTQPDPAPFPRHRILIVDDQIDVAHTEALLLSQLGQTVQCAYDGSSALAIAADFRPDIVLLDLDMPGMDGFETARQLRRVAAMRGARVIAHTGFARPEYRTATDAAGFDGFFVKPLRLADVIKVLKEAPPAMGEPGAAAP